MPRADEFPLLLPQIREDLRDYPIPGHHLHRPLALGTLRLPSGRLVTQPSSIPPGTPGLITAPSARVWPFTAKTNTLATRSTVVSPPFIGPALLTDISLDYSRLSTIAGGISFFYSNDGSGQLNDGNPQTLPAGTPILMRHSFHEPIAQYIDEVEEHLNPQLNNTVVNTIYHYPINFLVPLIGTFFLKVSVRAGGTEHVRVTGLLRILEGVDPADLPF